MLAPVEDALQWRKLSSTSYDLGKTTNYIGNECVAFNFVHSHTGTKLVPFLNSNKKEFNSEFAWNANLQTELN